LETPSIIAFNRMALTHIIIVNYNAGDWLQRSLSSACQFSAGKISIVDNASRDESVELASQRYPQSERVQWVLNSDNVGFAAANNQVIPKVETEFLVLMNPDCEINQQTLDLILAEFANHPKMGIASCKILNSDGSIQLSCKRKFPTPWSALSRMLFLYKLFPGSSTLANFDYGDFDDSDQVDSSLTAGSESVGSKVEFIEAISGAFMVVRCAAIKDVGLLDEDYFMHCEDLDWCKRFSLAGWQVGFIPAATVTHAKGVSSATRPIAVLWTLHKGMWRFFDKFYHDQHSFLLRAFVKLGIGVSFIVRSLTALLRRIFIRRQG